ncbi:uncharacterized protein LOC122092926 [Macadamia integrifolia]|uniref:uncharacterized protein LOC122092926 n=1 Tax=Macadamia integrifolia TaxID=60698 RepID=UPI001C52BA7D|nr:uncharacterized protein LOC122092926 [Macadamia integrifolia]
MNPEDKDKTSFTTNWGTYRYRVMSFGLKNAGATYQRGATTILHDLIHKEVKVYVDDMIVKSINRKGHFKALRVFFERIKEFKLRLNSQKCVFGVTGGILLGFMVSERGIEIDPSKIKTITEMSPPQTEKEIRGFFGRIQYISRFISQLTAICEPIFKLLKKDQPKRWNPQCQLAFDRIKSYLVNPPILIPPTPERPLLLYLSVLETSMGSMVAQYGPDGHTEQGIYYLSKKFTDYETRYTKLEKTCAALVWATRRLRHYMLNYSVFLKSIKDSVIVEHLSAHPVVDTRPSNDIFPDEDVVSFKVENEVGIWQMFFNGAANQKGYGAGVLLITPEGLNMPMAYRLDFECTNNMAKYETCLMGLKVAISIWVKRLEVYGDLSIVICQVQGKWKTKEEKLKPYQGCIESLMKQFTEISFDYFQRDNNRYADALATLASMVDFGPGEQIQPFIIDRRDHPSHQGFVNALTVDGRPWFVHIVDFIREGKYSADATQGDRRFLRHYATQFILHKYILYKRSFDGIQLVCMDEDQVQTILEQIFANLIYVPPTKLHTLSSLWPFSTWGIDVIGKINAKASNGHEFVLVAIDYFTKWVEAQSYAKLTVAKVAKFLQEHIICLYGMPHEVISNQGQHFRDKIQELCDQFRIARHRSSPYRPQTNGAVKAANKNMKVILQKMVDRNNDWADKLAYALWDYRTSIRTPTAATRYSLVYGMEVVLPIVLEVPSLRILMESQILEADWLKSRYEELNLIDEKRMKSMDNMNMYQLRVVRAFNKKVHPHSLEVGDLVLKKSELCFVTPIIMMDVAFRRWMVAMRDDDLEVLEEVHLYALFQLQRISPCRALIHEASCFWIRELHVFRFGTVAICPTLEEF